MRLYGTNVVDGTDLGTATRHPGDFAEANDVIANLPIERETGVEISRTHVIFYYYLFYSDNIFLRLYSTISFLDTVVQLAKWKVAKNVLTPFLISNPNTLYFFSRKVKK